MKKIKITVAVLLSVMAAGCADTAGEPQEDHRIVTEQQTEEESRSTQSSDGAEDMPAVTEHAADYSELFQGINGCAVIYEEASDRCLVYDRKKCETEVSPLSAFKIVSALAGLENHVLVNETSVMEYSGVKYPVDAWNSSLTLREAFEASCVWYFRQVLDRVGPEAVRTMLEELQYGNCDISEGEGSGVNSLPELNGFWLESSLKISPVQQVRVLRYIFGAENHFNAKNLETLKNIMYIEETDHGCLYGKTGSGTNGNAWFVGFAEENKSRTFFAVYLSDIEKKDIVSGSRAKETAIRILRKLQAGEM